MIQCAVQTGLKVSSGAESGQLSVGVVVHENHRKMRQQKAFCLTFTDNLNEKIR